MAEVMADEYGRAEPPFDGSEVATLLGFLENQRAVLEQKCRGLSDEQLRLTLPPSQITLGGLLKHLACVEDSWFAETVAGEPLPEPWASVDFEADPEWTWHSAAPDSGEYLRGLWTEGVDRSRAVMRAQLSKGEEAALTETHAAWGYEDPVSLRWVLVHMIEEYARHNGHADLIRESIDGQTG
ncbi:MAG TPA: DinB family protein [Streptosporangiaceae bacterium]